MHTQCKLDWHSIPHNHPSANGITNTGFGSNSNGNYMTSILWNCPHHITSNPLPHMPHIPLHPNSSQLHTEGINSMNIGCSCHSQMYTQCMHSKKDNILPYNSNKQNWSCILGSHYPNHSHSTMNQNGGSSPHGIIGTMMMMYISDSPHWPQSIVYILLRSANSNNFHTRSMLRMMSNPNNQS